MLCGSILAQAQNYRCINPTVKNYYSNASGFLRSIRIDSIKTIGTDTVLYPYHSFRGAYTIATLLDSNGASWWGKTITIHQDGITQFATQWGDTVFINTQAHTGDTWRFYDDTSQYYYTATVTNTIGAAGSDSIKIITVNSYSNTGINLSDTLNGITLLLSKNNGLIQTIDLGIFPMQRGDRRFDYTTDYLLSESVWTDGSGYDFSKANLQFKTTTYTVPDSLEVYNYNIGDMFMYTYVADNQVQYTTQYLYEIIGKQLLTGGVDYYIRLSTKHPNGTVNISAYHKVYSTGALYDTTYLPDEWLSKQFVYFDANDTAYCTKGKYRTRTNLVDYKQAYLHLFEPDKTDISYKKGIGSTYHYEQIGAGHTHWENALASLYKGTPCGPMPYMNVATPQANKTVIYPLPANDVVYININNNLATGSIAIINSIGIVVKTIQIEESITYIDVQDMPSGIYTLLLTTNTDKYYHKISVVH